MKKILSFILLSLLTFVLGAYEFTEIKNAPFEGRVYVLGNGLTVYLSKNSDEPRVQSYIAVRAGSAQDPPESTGLAHYFEHMMFKGNDKIASLDYASEKPILEKIEQLFEDYRIEKDEAKRKTIYSEIDKLSNEAARFSNDEYWTLVNTLGATNTNAWTSYDETVYMNDVPVNQLERFLKLEAVRFSDITLRRFHTELETVYEEFNRGQDNDARQAYMTLNSLLFDGHPYARSIIGIPEHLKNPSMRDIYAFFKKWYRPSNMALILVGDIDYNKTIKLVDETFGQLKNPSLPLVREHLKAEKLDNVKTAEIVGPTAENLIMAWRFEPEDRNEVMLDVISEILSNGKCGMFENNLILPRKLQNISAWGSFNNGYFMFAINAMPKEGQSLDELKDLILNEISKLKKGEFDDSLIGAALNNYRMKLVRDTENRSNVGRIFISVFIRGITVEKALEEYDLMEKVTKADVVKFVDEYFNDNYSIVFKRSGKPERIHAEKPSITPVAVPETPSPYAVEFAKIKPDDEPEAVFPDIAKNLDKTKIKEGSYFYSVKNTRNERFTLMYYFPGGRITNKELAVALEYMNFLGTEKYSPGEFKRQLYVNALELSGGSSNRYSYIALSGLQRNFPEAIALLREILTNVKPDETAWKNYVARTIQGRENAMKNQRSIIGNTIQFVLYGADNMNTSIIPASELEKLDPAKVVENIKTLFSKKGDVFYYGPEKPSKILDLLKSSDKDDKNLRAMLPESLEVLDDTQKHKIVPPETDTVYFLDYPSQQIQALIVRPDADFAVKPYTFGTLFTEYGPRLAMNELREKQALAYSAYVYYDNPGIFPDNYSLAVGGIGTQGDKLPTALDGLAQLLENTPVKPEVFEASKDNVLKVIRSSRYKDEDLFSLSKRMERMNITVIPEKIVYDELPALTSDEFAKLCKEHLSSKPCNIIIIGDKAKIDFEKLSRYGKVREITIDDIFPVK